MGEQKAKPMRTYGHFTCPQSRRPHHTSLAMGSHPASGNDYRSGEAHDDDS